MLDSEPLSPPHTTPVSTAARDCVQFLALAGDGVDPIGNGIAAMSLIHSAAFGRVDFPAPHVRQVRQALLDASLGMKRAVQPELDPADVEFGLGAAFGLVGQFVIPRVESLRLYADRVDHVALLLHQLECLRTRRRITERGNVLEALVASRQLSLGDGEPPTIH